MYKNVQANSVLAVYSEYFSSLCFSIDKLCCKTESLVAQAQIMTEVQIM
jgi:hypothetical protein